MKQLLVMRHGKSDWSSGAIDHDRPLTGRGERSARLMGRVLTRAGLAPDTILTSSATRALRTAELAADAGGWDVDITATRDLYDAWHGTVLEALAETADEVDRLMVVGHQPTWGALVEELTGGAVAMRTATVAVVDLLLGTSWRHDGAPRGELVAVLQPRHFTDGDWPQL